MIARELADLLVGAGEVVTTPFHPLLNAAEATSPDEAGDAAGDMTACSERFDAQREEHECERARDDDDDHRVAADERVGGA